MANNHYAQNAPFCAGELVQVRSREEILATLDQSGRLDGMPFMPEMLQYCGKRFPVFKRADKTCDNIKEWSIRRVKNAVHLTGVRCDGTSHGSCDAGCLLFWNEAWLKKADPNFLNASHVGQSGVSSTAASNGYVCSEHHLRDSVVRPDPSSAGNTLYTCQATELREFTSNLPWWDLRQYYRDVRSGNLKRGLGDSKSESFLETILSLLEVFRGLLITTFNKLQGIRGGVEYPRVTGSLDTSTPTVALDLKPGEWVQVRSKSEILATLDQRNRNRGLLFDSEMVRYCGSTFRVLKRVNQIVDERTGKMMSMKSPCIILEGVACVSEFHRWCPRAIYHYWREAWLQRIE